MTLLATLAQTTLPTPPVIEGGWTPANVIMVLLFASGVVAGWIALWWSHKAKADAAAASAQTAQVSARQDRQGASIEEAKVKAVTADARSAVVAQQVIGHDAQLTGLAHAMTPPGNGKGDNAGKTFT